MGGYTHLIWDWNGTLLNDLGWCVRVVNGLLERRKLPLLGGAEDYHRVFCFPIIEFYRNVGFDLEGEGFAPIAEEYIREYHAGDDLCPLQPGAAELLELAEQKGIAQVILSASEQSNLERQVDRYGIRRHFSRLLGISDIYAKSKQAVGMRYMEEERPERALLVGDTLHDWEVAKALGADCVLVSTGHNSREMLLTAGVPVLDGLEQLAAYL
ncbi:MAG: HAD family hydrolase [Oscillospiraceae bacterium]